MIFFGAIANYKNKTAHTTLVKPPGGSFPNQRFIESFNHGVIFNHLFLSSISFILPAMPSTKTFLVCLVFGFAVLIPFRGASTNSCELKAELFSITYMRNRSVQISLRFVYRGAVPCEVHFLRHNVYIDSVKFSPNGFCLENIIP